jgi:hypothetical protein
MTHVVGPYCKSSYSATEGNCVEVAPTADGRVVRDSKDRSGPVLYFTAKEWVAFTGSIKAGEFDR